MAKRRNWENDFEDDEDFDSENYEGEFDGFEDIDDFTDDGSIAFGHDVSYKNDPELAAYDPRLSKVLEHLMHYTEDTEAAYNSSEAIIKGLKGLPRSVGERVLSEALEIGGLEGRLSGVVKIAHQSSLQDDELFVTLTKRLRKVGDDKYHLAVNGIESSALDIGKEKDNLRFSDHLNAFLLGLQTGKVSPRSGGSFVEFVESPYLTDLALATKGNIPEIPGDIGKLLEDDEKRENYIKEIVRWPASVHLSADRFVTCVSDPQYKSFVMNWVGESASSDRVEYFDVLFQKYGYDGLVKIGKPLLRAVFNKGKGDSKLLEKLRVRGIGRVHRSIPEANQSPPAWMAGLRRRIEDAEPDQVLKIINNETRRIGEPDKEAELRNRYQTLVRKVKKTTPVSRGDYTTRDILMTLDDKLLDAMQAHEGKKTGMLQAMGKSLRSVNKTFRDSGLPATAVVGLYDSNYKNKQIREIVGTMEPTDIDALNTLQEQERLGTLFWLSGNGLRPDDIHYANSLESAEQAEAFDKVTRAVKDPRGYFSSLTLEQSLALREVDQDFLGEVATVVSPESIRDYVELSSATNGKINGALRMKRSGIDFSRFRGHEDAFNILEGSRSQEDAKSVATMILDSPDNETATRYCEALKQLSPYARTQSGFGGGQREFRFSPITSTIKKASDTELDVYGKIGEVYTKSSSWGSSRERIGFEQLQGVVKKTAELVDATSGLGERVDSFVGHIKNYASTQESLDDLSKLESIAKATVSATPDESQLLADIGSRHVGFTFTDQNLQKVRNIGDLGKKLDPLKAMSDLVRSEDQLGTVLDYAVHNTPEVLTTAYDNLKQGFSNDDEFYGTLAISRDKDLSEKAESMDQGYRPTFLKFAASVSSPDRLKSLPESHFYLAAQAYEFAKQHEMGSEFFDGLNGSLQQGTVDQWSNTIIKHFRDESKGGGVYRKLADENETRRYIQAG